MDTWRSQWIAEEADVSFPQIEPSYEECDVNNPNLSIGSIEISGDDQNKIESNSLKPTFKTASLAKRRLQAFSASKQLKRYPSKDEKIEDGDKSDKNFGIKKSKKALYPDDKAKAVIREIEEIKRTENVHKRVELNPETVAAAMKNVSSFNIQRARSRSLSPDRETRFKRREKRRRNYRQSDSISQKSASPEDLARKSEKTSSHKLMYPNNWAEYKQQGLTVVKDEDLKLKLFPRKKMNKLEFFDKIYNFDAPSPIIDSFSFSVNEEKVEIPFTFVRVTRSRPHITYCVNFREIKESFLTRNQLFQIIPRERRHLIETLFSTNSKVQPTKKKMISQQWYNKAWKKIGDIESSIFEKSVGLSFLQNYSDEEEDNDAEEIIICSSTKTKNSEEIKTVESKTTHVDKRNYISDDKKILIFDTNERKKDGIKSSELNKIFEEQQDSSRNILKDEEKKLKSIILKEKKDNINVIGNKSIDKGKQDVPKNIEAEERNIMDIFDLEDNMKSQIHLGGHKSGEIGKGKQYCKRNIQDTGEKDKTINSAAVKTTEKSEAELVSATISEKKNSMKKHVIHNEEKEIEYIKPRTPKKKVGPKEHVLDIEKTEFVPLKFPEEKNNLPYRSDGELTPEESFQINKIQKDELNETKKAIKELEAELERRQSLKLDVNDEKSKKKKKKKAKVNRKEDFSDSDDDSDTEPSKSSRKKQRKSKRRKSKKYSEEESSSSTEDEKRKKKKTKKKTRYIKDKTSKKKAKNKKTELQVKESKTKKKEEYPEEKAGNIESKKKKKRFSENQASEESDTTMLSGEHQKKKKKKTKRQCKESSDEDTDSDEDIESKTEKESADLESSKNSNRKLLKNKRKRSDTEVEQIIESEKVYEENTAKSRNYEITGVPSVIIKTSKNASEMDKGEKIRDSQKIEKKRKSSRDNFDKIDETRNRNEDMFAIKFHEKEYHEKIGEKLYSEIGSYKKIDLTLEVGRGKQSRDKSENLENKLSNRKSRERKRSCSLEKGNKGTPKSTEKYDLKGHLKKIQLNNIKLEPNWESLPHKRNKHKDDTLGLEKPPINVNLDEFPLAGLPVKGTSEKCDIRTPDTDDYRANWEKESFPVWESEDEVPFKPKGNNINNTCWESDEEVFERRHRSPEKQRPFNDSFDLEIPLNIKPFKKREIIDADAELEQLKIEGQNLTEERRQFEIEKLKVKQLELTVAQGVVDRGQGLQQHLSPVRKTKDEEPKDRFDIEVDKPRRGRWDKKVPVAKISTPKIDIIDLTKGTPTKLFEDENFTDNSSSASLNNSSAVLENEYEEFIKAVSSTISPKANSPKGHKQVESKNANFGINFSDFSDSNSSLEILRIKKISNTEKKSCQRKLSMIDDLPAVADPLQTLQTLILPKDIPFIPMPNEIKPVPVPSPQVDVQKTPTKPVINLSLSANITLDVTSKIDSPTQKTLDVIKSLPTVQVPVLLPPAPTNQSRELQNQSENTVSSTSIVTPSTQASNETTASITCVTATVPVGVPQKQIERKLSETVVNFASPLTDVSIDSNLFEEKTQTKGEKLFNFTSIVLPSKKLLIGNSNLKFDDSDDEIDQNMSLKKLEQIKKENTLIAASLTGEKEKETVQMETVQEKEHAKVDQKYFDVGKKVTEHPRSRSPIVKSHSRDIDNVDVTMRTRSQEKPPSPKRRRRDSSPRRREGSPRRREWSPRRRDDSPRRRDDSPRRRTGSPRRKAGSPRRRIGSPRRRDMSPRRRSRSPRRSSPRMRKSSPVKRRYASRWSNSPSRRRSISPRRRSPRNFSPRTSLARRMRSKSPEKSKFTGSYQQFAEMLKPKSPPAITSPLDGLKRSVADSTISDDSLLPQLNLDEYTESPVSRYYERILKMDESPKRMPLDVRINQELGYGKQEIKPKNVPYDIYNFEKSYVSQSHQFNKNEVPQKSVCLNASFPVLQNTFVQVGNMVQIVPTDMLDIKTERAVPEKALPEALNEYQDSILEKEAVFHLIESKALQVGNVIEIVPKDSPKELPKQSPKQLPKESPKHFPKETLKELPKDSSKELYIESPKGLHKESPKGLHKESPKGLHKESPKELHKESPKGLHKESPKELPKESPKELPKALPTDSPKELPKEIPKNFLKESPKEPQMPVVLKKEPEESVNTISVQEKQSAEVAMKLKVAERRAEREHRRQERENRRKEKEKRRREKEKQRQIKMKEKTENMIKRALQLEVEGLEDETSLLNSTPTQWPPLPALPSSSKDIGRSIMIRGGVRTRDSKLDIKKIVQFADGIKPGEGTSPSAGEELSSPRTPIKLPKEKRYKKTKFSKKLQKKKKVKVKIIKNLQADSDGEEDFLPPPSPPPGSPPPHVFPPRVKTPTINNIHPYLPNLLTVQPNPIQQLFRPPLGLLMAPPPMHHHGPRPRHHVPPPTIHHHGPPLPGPPHHHGPPPAGPPMHIHGPPPPPGPPHHHGPPTGPPGPLGPHHHPPPYHF